jgi:BirA family transcriptional regulator, biotin operon repressor / biotin---[acetyl-CoA-carboxylase] ligase
MIGPALPHPFRLVAYETIGSTNDELKCLAREGAAEGLVVTAQRQTAGRGRRGRTWMSPVGNLYSSTLLRPDCPPAMAAQLGFVAALGVADAIGELAPQVHARCKWPNDLLANGKKICGILLETEMVSGDRPDFVILGVGVNLISSPRDTPYPATSLAEEGAPIVTPAEMAAAFIRHFATWLTSWREGGFAPIRQAWLARAMGLGEPIQVRLERATLEGKFLDLDEDGALLLGQAGGSRRIAAGEIFPARAA